MLTIICNGDIIISARWERRATLTTKVQMMMKNKLLKNKKVVDKQQKL